jgi:DNA-binding phage protein
MPKLKLRKWGSAEHLKTEEDMALYLEASPLPRKGALRYSQGSG